MIIYIKLLIDLVKSLIIKIVPEIILGEIMSVAVGARIVEKHFTIDNNYSDFHDHKLSSNPVDFKKMVEKIRLTEEMLSDGRKITTAVESENKEKIRRSIVAKYDLESGHVLTIDDLDWVRPGGGIKPGLEDLLVGKKLKLAIKKGCKIVSNSLK